MEIAIVTSLLTIRYMHVYAVPQMMRGHDWVCHHHFDILVNNRAKVIKILAMAKSAIRHNMAKDLPNIKTPIALIWGENDKVTPPEVAKEFNNLLPNSKLFWIKKCGHAPMMEHPNKFNEVVKSWFAEKNF